MVLFRFRKIVDLTYPPIRRLMAWVYAKDPEVNHEHFVKISKYLGAHAKLRDYLLNKPRPAKNEQAQIKTSDSPINSPS